MNPRSRFVAAVLIGASLAPGLGAHHILGIPHYAYDENYPQAPVITYKVAAGPFLLELTGYPGKPIPGELSTMHAYIYRDDASKDVFPGPIEASVTREALGSKETIFGPVATRFEEKLHKFSPVYGEAGRYNVRLEMELEGQPYEIDFPIAVGDPPNPFATLVAWLGAIALLIVVVRAIKIKRERRLGARN